MSRAPQAEQLANREEEELAEAYANGEISRREYNARMQDIQRDVQEAYHQDQEDALERVRDEWGW